MLTIPVKDELIAKIENAKGLLAHSRPGISTSELIEYALDEVIEALEKAQRSKLSMESKVAAPRNPSKPAVGRYVRAVENRALWQNNSQCSNCGSTYALERDHKIPFAKGGSSEAANLRLLCRSCNQRAAIEHYGARKMSQYLRSPRTEYQI